MFIETVTLSNFRCFGTEPAEISLASGLTVFIGSNGSGKTALMQALLRLFGISNEQRHIRKRDFHIPLNETGTVAERSLFIEAILVFPELNDDTDTTAQAVPEFFKQMTVDIEGVLKCRIRLEATWADDGTAEGAIQQDYFVITALGKFDDNQKQKLSMIDRGRIQVIYVPAVRDGISQVTNALKGRLWKAISWSQGLKDVHADAGTQLQINFENETAIRGIKEKLNARWGEVHSGGTDTEVFFSPVDTDFESFVKGITVGFRPGEDGKERPIDELSDGQRSLFHISFTTALLDIENEMLQNEGAGFQAGGIYVPALTILAIEEPENNLAPFYLSRIIRQVESIVGGNRGQAIVSSHSASTLTRVNPEDIRYFRCNAPTRLVTVKSITLPDDTTEAGKYVREAVRAFPEVYFAKFVVLGEGDSELIVLPKLAESLGLQVDPSFVAIVPLGGRHVNHFWRLLNDLEIPHATLLDLDLGRHMGGWGRIKYACLQLIELGLITEQKTIETINSLESTGGDISEKRMRNFINKLRQKGIFFSEPLDIDMIMLLSYPTQYQILEEGARGPSGEAAKAKIVVLKEEGDPTLYPDTYNQDFLWYRYLFLGRGKPSTHIKALSGVEEDTLSADMPEPLRALLNHVGIQVALEPDCDDET